MIRSHKKCGNVYVLMSLSTWDHRSLAGQAARRGQDHRMEVTNHAAESEKAVKRKKPSLLPFHSSCATRAGTVHVRQSGLFDINIFNSARLVTEATFPAVEC